METDTNNICQPIYRSDDEGDGGEADSRGGPLADRQGPLCSSAQQVERCGTHAVNGEAWDDHRGEGLPHESVHHCCCYPRRPPWVVPMGL